ncbi:hypothetical protein N1851_023454 [Merluccius polli]|uniref:Uncharacterized protein n=1 Tax=Merluccius polli TaxID=89951 RepID=A0AA47NV20_MERPO|nr:hypothetical protein N1851_023454 [Merluccius polli]
MVSTDTAPSIIIDKDVVGLREASSPSGCHVLSATRPRVTTKLADMTEDGSSGEESAAAAPLPHKRHTLSALGELFEDGDQALTESMVDSSRSAITPSDTIKREIGLYRSLPAVLSSVDPVSTNQFVNVLVCFKLKLQSLPDTEVPVAIVVIAVKGVAGLFSTSKPWWVREVQWPTFSVWDYVVFAGIVLGSFWDWPLAGPFVGRKENNE